MSVDTKVTLPAGAQIADVAMVIALLLGKSRTWTECKNTNNYREGLTEPTANGWCTVEGISYSTSDNQPHCCTINIGSIPQQYGDGWWFFYHFEFGGGHHGMSGGSRAERIALHKRLVDVFGGTVDYNDCDSREVDYRRKSPNWLGKSDDKNFHAKHIAFWAITPITPKEIAACNKPASYKKGAAA